MLYQPSQRPGSVPSNYRQLAPMVDEIGESAVLSGFCGV
jgi:hypothetical protein